MSKKRKFKPTLAFMSEIVQVLFRRTNGTVSSITAEMRTEDKWRHTSENEVQIALAQLTESRKDITKDGLWYTHVVRQ